MENKSYQKTFIEQLRKKNGLTEKDDAMIKDCLDMIDEELITPKNQMIGMTLYDEYYDGHITEIEFNQRMTAWNKNVVAEAMKKFKKKYGRELKS